MSLAGTATCNVDAYLRVDETLQKLTECLFIEFSRLGKRRCIPTQANQSGHGQDPPNYSPLPPSGSRALPNAIDAPKTGAYLMSIAFMKSSHYIRSLDRGSSGTKRFDAGLMS